MEVSCQVCGKPVYVQDVPEFTHGVGTFMRSELCGAAKMVVHSEKPEGSDEPTCYEVAWRRFREKDAAALLAERMQTLAGTVPPEFQDTRLDHIKMKTPAALAALRWEYRANGLLLSGPSGEAKSRCAYEVLRRQHMAGSACCQYTAGEWAFQCLKLMHDFKVGERWLNMVKACDILMIDDLGKSRLTYQDHNATQATELLFDVIDNRCKNKRPTFITTNMTSTDFKAKWGEHGEAFRRRLTEYSCGVKFGPCDPGKMLFGVWRKE